jgi:hypothetical protein
MAVTVKRITLWRGELPNRAGALAEVLGPLSAAGANLGVVMGYRIPGQPDRAVVEVAPVAGKKAEAAAAQAGLGASAIPTLLAAGDDKPGLGHAMSRAIADAGINMNFLVAQTIGRRFTAIIGFENEADAQKAVPLVKKAKPAGKQGKKR